MKKPHCDISSEKEVHKLLLRMLTHIEKGQTNRMQKFWTDIKIEFERLCEEYNDIFSKDSSDIGKTPFDYHGK